MSIPNDEEFISRCMSNDDMVKEYPEANQRLAVCNKAFFGEFYG